jgi:hypothetical protein
MATDDLRDYVRTNPAKGFESRPHYSADGDCLSFYFCNADHFAVRVNEVLTVYRDMKSRELIGWKIKGVRRIIETFDQFEDMPERPRLQMLLLPSMAMAHDPEEQELYKQILEAMGDMLLDIPELEYA